MTFQYYIKTYTYTIKFTMMEDDKNMQLCKHTGADILGKKDEVSVEGVAKTIQPFNVQS